MPKASPIILSGNGGEVSALMEGRTDWNRYPASMRKSLNCVAAQQGPVLSRSGTAFLNECKSHTSKSALEPFVYNETQTLVMEFSEDTIRFADESGVHVYTPITIASIVTESPFVVQVVGLGASVGEQIALAGFPETLNVNQRIGNITNKVGDNYTLDLVYSNPTALDVSSATAARVLNVASTYKSDDVQNIRVIQSVDFVYILCPGHRIRVLKRSGATAWALTEHVLIDGPYLPTNDTATKLTPASTGNAALNSAGTAGMTGTPVGGKEPSKAFDEDASTYWQSDTNQEGTLEFDPTVDFACTGYSIQIPKDNSDTNFTNQDYAPGDWRFEGYNGSAWVLLDAQSDYVLYDGARSVFFPLTDTTVYQKYRIVISKCTRNGGLAPRIAALALTSAASVDISIAASGTLNLNDGDGFKSTDVDRLIRLKGSDNKWRALRVKTFTDTQNIVATLLGSPFPDTDAVFNWRLGLWSDTTGWPVVGTFFDDRLVLGGASGSPDTLAGTIQGSTAYTSFAPTDEDGVVLADSGFVVATRSRKLSAIRWVDADERAILVGTGSEEFNVSAPDAQEAFGPLNIRSRRTSSRGSADVEPVSVDKQVLYVQRARRAVREMVYVFAEDGYKAPSMSTFSGHIGSDRFAEMDYAAEPHSIVFIRQDSGKLAGLTYNRDESVIGWHRHDVGGEIESMCVLPSSDDRQDTLWLSVKRTVDGSEKRYIEYLKPFWDFGDTIDDAFFVDCGLKTTLAAESDTVTGLWHLEGLEVYGLADDIPFDKQVVEEGKITLVNPASRITVGLPFVSEAEWSRIDAGSAEGSSLGKETAIAEVVLMLWDSAGGEICVWSEDGNSEGGGEVKYDSIPYSEEPYSETETVAELFTGETQPIPNEAGWSKRSTVGVRQSEPLPLNVVALLPRLETSDGG